MKPDVLILAALLLAPLAELHAADTIKPWTLGERDGRQCLITHEGKPFLMLGISHVGGALGGLNGAEWLQHEMALGAIPGRRRESLLIRASSGLLSARCL